MEKFHCLPNELLQRIEDSGDDINEVMAYLQNEYDDREAARRKAEAEARRKSNKGRKRR